MATADRIFVAHRADPANVPTTYVRMGAVIALTMSAGATVNGSYTPPAGAVVTGMKSLTPTAFSGSPTNINLTVGKTAGGQDYVATVDKKAANAADALTMVAAPDYASWSSGRAIIAQIAAVGGANAAGTMYVEIEFSAPNP